MNSEEYIISQMGDIGISIDTPTAQKYLQYYRDVVERNKAVNLTAITEYEEFVNKHFLDSVLPLTTIVSRETIADGKNPEKDVSRETFSMIDVGTGAGFPGIPLKLANPSINLTLLDSLDKRVKFLHEEIENLKLTNVKAIHARAEDGARDETLREGFDVAVSRAVADLRVLAEYVMPFVKVGGIFIAYKAKDSDEEIEAAKKAIAVLGGVIEEIVEKKLPKSDAIRRFVVIRKISATPEKYPRKAGKPSKSPIS